MNFAQLAQTLLCVTVPAKMAVRGRDDCSKGRIRACHVDGTLNTNTHLDPLAIASGRRE